MISSNLVTFTFLVQLKELHLLTFLTLIQHNTSQKSSILRCSLPFYWVIMNNKKTYVSFISFIIVHFASCFLFYEHFYLREFSSNCCSEQELPSFIILCILCCMVYNFHMGFSLFCSAVVGLSMLFGCEILSS